MPSTTLLSRKKTAAPVDGKEPKVDLTLAKWSNERHSIESTAKKGYMCQVEMRCNLDMTPKQLFSIFCHPDSSHLFRDLGKTVKYEVTKSIGSKQMINIEQQAVLRFLAIPVKFSTYLRVEIDFEKLSMKWQLTRWGTMRKFEGEWELEPVMEGDRVVGCKCRLVQHVLPIIVPPFLTGVLSGVATNVVKRMLEDMEVVAERLATGEKMGDILGWSKWIDENEKLKEWRGELDAEREKVGNDPQDPLQDCQSAASDFDGMLESKPPSTGAEEDNGSVNSDEGAPDTTEDNNCDVQE